MSSESYHEPIDLISERIRNLHRGLTSLIEELEAVDWYTQRAEACSDAELRAVILHNRDEEIEHAMMTLEWLRRSVPEIDKNARTYLFTEGPITEAEQREKAGPAGGSLGIGGLRKA
jgi:ferritin-like protein